MRIQRIHHVTLAVRDLEQARATFASLFGAEPDEGRDIAAFSARQSDITIGEDMLQLVSPLEPDTPLTRFLDRRGEGFYNIALEVDNLDEAVAELAERGVRVSEPIEASPGVRSAFITMSATHGLSVQLLEIVGASAGVTSEALPHVPPRAEDATIESWAAAPAADAPASSPPLLDLTPDEWSDVD